MPVAVTERATKLGIKVFRSYGSTEHPSITGCLLDEPEVKRLTAPTAEYARPGWSSGSTGDGDGQKGRSSAGDPTAASATPNRP